MNRFIGTVLAITLIGLFSGFAMTMGWIIIELMKEMSQ